MRKSLSEASMTKFNDVSFDATAFLGVGVPRALTLRNVRREVKQRLEWGTGGEF